MKTKYLLIIVAVLFPLLVVQAGDVPSPYAIQLEPKEGTGVVPQSVVFLPGTANKVKISDADDQVQEYNIENIFVMPGATPSRDCTAVGKDMQESFVKYFVSIFAGLESVIPPNSIDPKVKAAIDNFVNGIGKMEDLPGVEPLFAEVQKKICPDGKLIDGLYEFLMAQVGNDGETPVLNPMASTFTTTGEVAAVVKNNGVTVGIVTLIYGNNPINAGYSSLDFSPRLAFFNYKDDAISLRSFGSYILSSAGKCKIAIEGTSDCPNEQEPISITAVDLNGDGNDDLVVGDRKGLITIYLGTPGAFFPFTSVGFIEVGEPFEPYGMAVSGNAVLVASAAPAIDGKFYVYKVWLQDGVPAMKQIEVTTPDTTKGPFKITAFDNGLAFVSASVSPATQSVEFGNAVTVYQLIEGEYKFAGDSYVQKMEETNGQLKSVAELSSIAYTPAKDGVLAGLWAGDYYNEDETYVYFFPIEDEANLLIGAPSTFTTGTEGYGVIDVKPDADSNVAVATGIIKVWQDISPPPPPPPAGAQKLPQPPGEETPEEPEVTCGNGVCDAGEDLGNCPEDCPKTDFPPAYDDSKKRDKCTTGPKKGAMVPKTPYNWTLVDNNNDEEPDWCQCWQLSKDTSTSDKDGDGVGDKVGDFLSYNKMNSLIACDNCDPQENQCKESTKAAFSLAPCYNPMQTDSDGDGLGDACVKVKHEGDKKRDPGKEETPSPKPTESCVFGDKITIPPIGKDNTKCMPQMGTELALLPSLLYGKTCYVNDLNCNGSVDVEDNLCVKEWNKHSCPSDLSTLPFGNKCNVCLKIILECVEGTISVKDLCTPSANNFIPGAEKLDINLNPIFPQAQPVAGAWSGGKQGAAGSPLKAIFGGQTDTLSKGAVVIFINQKKAVKEAITPFPGECIMEIGRNGKSPTGLGSADTPYSKWIMAQNDRLRKTYTEHKNGTKGNPNYHASDKFAGELATWISRCNIPTGAAQQIAVYQTAGPRLEGRLLGKSGMRPAYPPPQFEIASKEPNKPNKVVTRDDYLTKTVTRLATLNKSVDAQYNVSAMFLPNETPLTFVPSIVAAAKLHYLWPSEHVFVKGSMTVDIAEKASEPLMRIKVVQPEGLPSMSISEGGETATPANVTAVNLEGYAQLDSGYAYAEGLMGPSYYSNNPEVFIDAFEKAMDEAGAPITFNEAAEQAWKIVMTPGNKVVYDPFLTGKFLATSGQSSPIIGYIVLPVISAPAGGPGGGGWGCGLIRN